MNAQKQKAEAYYFNHPQYSWAQFVITEKGDLFLNSDWGTYGCAWRAFGDDFKDFLIKTNADYVMGNFEPNINMTVSGSRPFRLKGVQRDNVIGLFQEFQKLLVLEKENGVTEVLTAQ